MTAQTAVKLAVLLYLNETYGITEEDFMSAELILTPAAKAGSWALTGA